MQLNNKIVNEFQKLYLKKFGVTIGYAVAESQLKDLAQLIRLTSEMQEAK